MCIINQTEPIPSPNSHKPIFALRALRAINGHSQESFADEVGIDRSYMGGIERGEHNLALVNLLKISKALKMPASKLLEKAKI